MAKYKAYSEYKDSGVEFLGRVPNEWSVKSLKNIALIVNGSTPKSGVEEYWDGDINWITPTDLSHKSGVYLNDSQRKITNKGLDSCGTSLVPENTVILSTRAPIGSLAITGNQSCTNQGCKSLVVKNKESSLFLYYYLSISTSPLNNLGRGSTFLELSTEDLASFKVPMPNVGIGTIVSFLEHETAKIDNLIEKQQQLIELLKEKRQAVISHAVTKGINPDVPMKDSGVEWLGEVPDHWEITKLKWVGRTTSGGTPTTSKFEIYYEDGHVPWIRTTDLNNGELFDTPIRITSKAVNDTACSILPVGSVLLGMYGGAGSIGKHAILRFESTINQAVCGVLPCGKILPDFLHKYYEFYRPFWMVDAAGTRKDPNIGQDNIKEGIILMPPFEEQVEINNHINNMRNVYECIIENALEGVDLLQERRTALISAAVTGKIDVRDWVAPDTQDVEEPQEATA